MTARTALVTGGSRGIGLGIVERLVADGCRVAINGVRGPDAVAPTLAALRDEGADVVYVRGSVADPAGRASIVEGTLEAFGRIDVLVNNAGITSPGRLDILVATEENFDLVMATNLKGPFFLTQKLLPLLREAATWEDPARIVNIASIDGLHNNPIETYSYAASKAGLIHLTRSLARHLVKDDILVNAIAPGPFDSKMMAYTLETMGEQIKASNPRRRIGTPEDIAGTAIYLCSRASAYTTGETITVDGGIVHCS